MARMPRLVVPGYPHHVTQRGARRMTTFFCTEDYRSYLALLRECATEADVEIWAYCLMPNHVHLVIIPQQPGDLARIFRSVHRRYTRHINLREDWQGHLWQERFHSFVMDEPHLLAAVRYVELNPVRSGLCSSPHEWPFSSVHAHLAGHDDDIVSVRPMLERVRDWSSYLGAQQDLTKLEALRAHSSTGRPAGNDAFLEALELLTKRSLRKGKPGPRRRIK